MLRRTPEFTSDLEGSLRALRDLAKSPTTDLTLAGLTATMKTLNPTLRYVGPHVTVCNYFNYFWTFLADHISEEDATGTVQRIQVKRRRCRRTTRWRSFGATRPANGGTVDPVTHALAGDAAALHDQIYGRAVDEQGNADCEAGQRGYPDARRRRASRRTSTSPSTRAPRATRARRSRAAPRVPAGQTFSARAQRHRAAGGAVMRDRGPSPFAVGAVLIVVALIVTYLGFRKDVPFVNSPYTIKMAVRDTNGIKAARPCGSPASRSAASRRSSTRARARGRRR